MSEVVKPDPIRDALGTLNGIATAFWWLTGIAVAAVFIGVIAVASSAQAFETPDWMPVWVTAGIVVTFAINGALFTALHQLGRIVGAKP